MLEYFDSYKFIVLNTILHPRGFKNHKIVICSGEHSPEQVSMDSDFRASEDWDDPC